ncbi:MAG: acetylxylan esterase [Lentisphaeria bacterium]|nr:acetylxylan esterase [Lentisphaeria bacterium]
MHNHRSILGNYVQDFTVSQIRALNKERDARLAALKTKADAEAYVKSVREKIAACFPMPDDHSVPQCEIVKTAEYDKFKIENIIYLSRNNFPVTANLYVPKAPGKHPGAIILCGHAGEGKSCSAYRSGAANLAEKGFVVLLIDPIAQGERWQFMNVPHASAFHGKCTREHNMLGKQLRLCGEFFGAWRAYDAIRGLDYLLSRPEVDPARIGITGNSGGGTMSSFVQALDARFTMAAPSCYITSWKRNFENELPADVEQIPPGILAAGCEMGDLILCYAPRPILLLGQKNDFFDPRGLNETYEQVKKVYALLGAEDNVQCFIGPTNHGYSIENREAMYGFFTRHAGLPIDGKENFDSNIITAASLNCTESGQLMTSRPEFAQVHDLTVKLSADLAAARPVYDVSGLKAKLRELLQLPEKIEVPYARTLRPFCIPGVPDTRRYFNRFALERDNAPLTMLKLNSEPPYFHFPALDTLTIYVPHLDSGSELIKLDRADDDIYAGLDVSNIGETLSLATDHSEEGRKFSAPYSQDYHYDSVQLMYGTSMIARRVEDILSAIAFVKAQGVKHVKLTARGQGAVPAAMAALLSDDVEAVTLYDTLESYQSVINKRVSDWPQSCMIPGVLKYMDLPDIYAALKAEKPAVITFVNEPVPEF